MELTPVFCTPAQVQIIHSPSLHACGSVGGTWEAILAHLGRDSTKRKWQ